MKKILPLFIFLVLFSACSLLSAALVVVASSPSSAKIALTVFPARRAISSSVSKKASPLIAKRSAESLTILGSVKDRLEAATYLADNYDDESSLVTACRTFFQNDEFATIIKRTDKISLETAKNELIKLRLLSLAQKRTAVLIQNFSNGLSHARFPASILRLTEHILPGSTKKILTFRTKPKNSKKI